MFVFANAFSFGVFDYFRRVINNELGPINPNRYHPYKTLHSSSSSTVFYTSLFLVMNIPREISTITNTEYNITNNLHASLLTHQWVQMLNIHL